MIVEIDYGASRKQVYSMLMKMLMVLQNQGEALRYADMSVKRCEQPSVTLSAANNDIAP